MIFLFLFCVVGAVRSETHRLQYIYTAFSKPASQAGLYQFTALGMLDNRLIDSYNSVDRVKIPQQDWMKDNNPVDYWEKGTQSRRSKEQWFNVNVNILTDRMRQNHSDLHTLQWMHGCEADRTADGELKFRKGFDQYGYDGEDFLSFDNTGAQWVAPVTEAVPTKNKWDNVAILSQYTKGYLETDCVDWLKKFLSYQEKQHAEAHTFSPPKVHLFAKKSAQSDLRTLVCLATGFYPKDVEVNLLRNGVPLDMYDGVWSSGIRPNGDKMETYQLRKSLDIKASDTAKYSCSVKHRTLKEPIVEDWDGVCCNCEAEVTAAIIGTAVTLIIVLGVILIVMKKKELGCWAPKKSKKSLPNGNIFLGNTLAPLDNVAVTLIPNETDLVKKGSHDSGIFVKLLNGDTPAPQDNAAVTSIPNA